jgi:hypothetical protein
LFAWALLLGATLAVAYSQQPAKYVTLGAVPPGWQLALVNYGDRLQRPGKERLTISGTVVRNGSSTSPFQLIHELPNSVSYTEQSGVNASTLVFAGGQFAKSGGGTVQQQDLDLIETLAYDSQTRLLYLPSNNIPVRKLGSRFRSDGQTGKVYSGPVYDVYLVMESVQQVGKVKQQAKYFHVNSDTQLLDSVHYQDADNPNTRVDVFLDNWTRISNNQAPQTIRRLENGVEVLRFTVGSAVLGPSVADGAFQLSN